ncbi:MAG: hypothetical protein IKY90_00960 [Oscillospiraceae bacterium]|nr:hypothetical protein [Oscillospiraceae bacterium]
MKTIYLNANFECSVSKKADTVQSIETDYFDGKCNAFIEGYRFIPAGQQWTRKDGVVFEGEMIAPFKDSTQLEMVQSLYEQLKGE